MSDFGADICEGRVALEMGVERGSCLRGRVRAPPRARERGALSWQSLGCFCLGSRHLSRWASAVGTMQVMPPGP